MVDKKDNFIETIFSYTFLTWGIFPETLPGRVRDFTFPGKCRNRAPSLTVDN